MRKRRSRSAKRRNNRKRENLYYNLRWFLGGLGVGLPLLAATLYLASR